MTEMVAVEKYEYADETQALNALGALYQDKTPVRRHENDRHWLFELCGSRSVSENTDPDLEKNLAAHFNLSIEEISDYAQFQTGADQHPDSVLCFDHCWALSLWSRWLEQQKSLNFSQKPLLVRFDAHDDLGLPSIRLSDTPWEFLSPVDQDRLDLRDHRTVNRFIRRGFIGIGSFIIPLLHAMGGFDIVYVVPAKTNEDPWVHTRSLICSNRSRTVRGIHGRYPTLELEDKLQSHNSLYMQTNDPQQLQQIIARGPVFLDVDMDYFSNAYDSHRKNRFVPSPDHCLHNMEAVLAALKQAPFLPRVEALSMALSPNFFPSALWPDALAWRKRVLQAIPGKAV